MEEERMYWAEAAQVRGGDGRYELVPSSVSQPHRRTAGRFGPGRSLRRPALYDVAQTLWMTGTVCPPS